MSKILTNRDGNIRLELRDDRLSAWLTIHRSGRLTDERDILALIDEAGIKTGFDEAGKYMRKHGLEKDFDSPFPIAMCNRVKGETKLNYFFDLDLAKHFDGRVQPQDLEKLTCIEAGTVIADYSNNIFERQGSIYDIYGEMLQDEEFDLEAARQVAGENVSFNLDKRQFVAGRSGFVSVGEDGRISVVAKLFLAGDIQNEARELRSQADLEIGGNLTNTTLYAAGNLCVRGDLKNVKLSCRGDLSLDGQIIDCRQPGLEVGGNIRCLGIISSLVLCRGGIEFQGQITASEVVADGGINSATGSLCGGHLESGGSVLLRELGDPGGGETGVEITIGPYHKALLMRMTRDMIRLKDAPELNSEAIGELNLRIKACEEELDGQLNRFLTRTDADKLVLRVLGELHPPVRMRVLKHEYHIQVRKTGLEIWEKD